MAELTGHKQIYHANTDTVDSSLSSELGSRSLDSNGNEFVYLQGVSSVTAGSWVVFDESYVTTLLVADEVGPVAIAMATVDNTSEFGWFQIFGVNTVAKTDTIAADSSLYIDGTAGRVDDLGVTGDLVIGAYSMTADVSNVATVFITYPSVSNDIGGSAGALSILTATGDVDDSNTTFTFSSEPSIVVVNGASYIDGSGVSISTTTATLDNPVGTGGSIYGIS